ncbi:hypothetical protein M7I_3123 [Glarea lozoyensis 74030]|uniref:Uncharacterized protein n=1 Tax=Glarea lozoyensis (strain ATCC 74030 / MF5533) TaxID=1104152 RepID=H0EKM4_GLAL7|nr:hypothetical protein M7I_3123 [Glarea lozoyensis 74030]
MYLLALEHFVRNDYFSDGLMYDLLKFSWQHSFRLD